MKRVLPVLAVLTLLVACSPAPSIPASSPPGPGSSSLVGPSGPPPGQGAATGYLHTDGTLVVDAEGHPAPLRGVNDSAPTKTKTRVPDEAEMAQLRSWGFTALRLPLHWHDLEPTAPAGGRHMWNENYLHTVDTIVAAARAHGIRIILDMHQASWSPVFGGVGFPEWMYPDATDCTRKTKCVDKAAAACSFLRNEAQPGVAIKPWDGMVEAWKVVATRYKDDPTVVGADLFNEPQACGDGAGGTYRYPTPTSTPVDDLYDLLGRTVQAIEPRWLLIYEDDAYSSFETKGFALTRRLDLPNAVYSSHFYADSWDHPNGPNTCKTPPKDTGRTVIDDHLARAAEWNQPFFLGEFDGFHQTLRKNCPFFTDEAGASADTRALMTRLKEAGSSWTLWTYTMNGGLVDESRVPQQPLLADLQTGL